MIKIDRAGYDPDWRARWARAKERFESLPPTATNREIRAALEALHQAHDAQFATVAELAEFRFRALKRTAFNDGFMLAVRPLNPEATEAHIGETWRSAAAQLEAAKRARIRPPLGQPEGLEAFGPTRPFGATRNVALLETVTPSGRPQPWAALIERRGLHAHVCLVQIAAGRGVEVGFATLATLAYRHLLAMRPWRPWTWVSPHCVHFYGYIPWGSHDAGQEIFAARALRWRGGRYVEDDGGRRALAPVPYALAALDPVPEARHLVIEL